MMEFDKILSVACRAILEIIRLNNQVSHAVVGAQAEHTACSLAEIEAAEIIYYMLHTCEEN
jgi:hypothetical protein